MALAWDEHALESIPLRLMIVAVVATMSIVPASEALHILEYKRFLADANEQLGMLIGEAERLAMEGPWNIVTLRFDFTASVSPRFEALVVGDSAGGANMSSAVLVLSDGARIVRCADEPPVWLVSASGGPLVLSSPVFSLRLRCEILDGVERVTLEAL